MFKGVAVQVRLNVLDRASGTYLAMLQQSDRPGVPGCPLLVRLWSPTSRT